MTVTQRGKQIIQTPTKILHAIKTCGGCQKMHFVKVATLLLTLYRCMFVGGTKPNIGSITSRCSGKRARTHPLWGGSKTGPGRRRKSSLNLIFHSKTILESAKCKVLLLQPMKTIQLMVDLTPSFQFTFMYLAFNYLKLNDKWSINYIEIRPFELMDKIKIFFP